MKLRDIITKFLLKDFNLKPKVRTVEAVTKKYKMDIHDAEQFCGLCNKYNVNNILEDYPYWLVSEMRSNVLECLRSMIRNITIANSIYPYSLYECDMRRYHQNLAIGECEYLLQEFHYIMNNISLDANKIMPYVQLIEEEIMLLKTWRKSDNKIKKAVMANSPIQYTFVPQQYIQYPMITEPCDEKPEKETPKIKPVNPTERDVSEFKNMSLIAQKDS
jgi:hypothetical protein